MRNGKEDSSGALADDWPQVHKRINRRLAELGLTEIADYQCYLEDHPSEWSVLDGSCRIPISRFYRDRDVFDRLRDETLPELAGMALDGDESRVRIWSAGCASGEEPYTLSILWKESVQPKFPQLQLHVIATDVDEQLLHRAGGANAECRDATCCARRVGVSHRRLQMQIAKVRRCVAPKCLGRHESLA